MFSSISSFCLDTVIIKFNVTFSPGFIFIVLLKAILGDTVSPKVLENGIESCITFGTPTTFLFNFSPSISYSKSPMVSFSVYKFAPK